MSPELQWNLDDFYLRIQHTLKRKLGEVAQKKWQSGDLNGEGSFYLFQHTTSARKTATKVTDHVILCFPCSCQRDHHFLGSASSKTWDIVLNIRLYLIPVFISPSSYNDFSFKMSMKLSLPHSPIPMATCTEHCNSLTVCFPLITLLLQSMLQRIFILIFVKHPFHHISSSLKFFQIPLIFWEIGKHFFPSVSNCLHSEPLSPVLSNTSLNSPILFIYLIF